MREKIDEKARRICYTCTLEICITGKRRKMVEFLETNCHVREWMAYLDGEKRM